MMYKDDIFGIEPVIDRGEEYEPLTYVEIYKVLEDIMDLDPAEDLYGIQVHGPNPRRVDVAAKCRGVWEDKDLYQYMNKEIVLDNNRIVLITRPYEDFVLVRAKRMPMWWESEFVKRIFNYYGEVKEIQQEVIKGNYVRQDYHGLRDGNWLLKMKVAEHIPSTLTVCGERFEIYYRGQIKTCWKCGMAHMKHECKTLRRHFVNHFDISEFPELPIPPVISPSQVVTTSAPSEVVQTGPTVSTAAPTTPPEAPVTPPEVNVTPPEVTITPPEAPVTPPEPEVPEVIVTQPVTVPAETVITTTPEITSAPVSTAPPEIAADLDMSMDAFIDAPEISATAAEVTTQVAVPAVTTTQALTMTQAAKVQTVNSLPPTPKSSTIQMAQEDHLSDSSDGKGTIDDAYERLSSYSSPPRIEVHHSENSPNVKGAIANLESRVDSEVTWSASEREDDLLTPGQRQNEDVGISQHQEVTDDEIMTVEVDPAQFENLFKDEGKRLLGSSDEDTAPSESIMMNIGSFVNSFLGGSQEKKRTKTDLSQPQADSLPP